MNLESLKGKTKITITIDKTLLEEIEEIRRKEKIVSLSGFINALLWGKLKDENKDSII